jgi:hypothetical protein
MCGVTRRDPGAASENRERYYEPIGQCRYLQLDIHAKSYTFMLQAQQWMLKWFNRRVSRHQEPDCHHRDGIAHDRGLP